MKIRCAISPDADDRFMFRAIELGLIDTEGLDFEIVAKDTEALNHTASDRDDPRGPPDVTAISIAHYPAIADRYLLLNHGGSVGRNYGPVLIARGDRVAALRRSLAGARIAVPGVTTTACLTLRLLAGASPASPVFTPVTVPIAPPSLTFDALRDASPAGPRLDAALIIHEGRLTYAAEGFALVMDIGEAWTTRTGLPLPLGGNVVRRDLEIPLRERINRVIHASIEHALLRDRAAAIGWLLERPGPLRSVAQVDEYLKLYANADTLDYGADGREGIQRLLGDGAAVGWLPRCTVDVLAAPTASFTGATQDPR
ncbi:MAG: ABC transporter substrate-binding protein [Myxococcales bacterium]|nr:ABC transporter substrate-binding protein [Myxococcales bacterium]